MATRRINGTLDTFSVDAGSEISYVGGSTTGDKSDDVRGFEVNPGGTGNIIVTPVSYTHLTLPTICSV